MDESPGKKLLEGYVGVKYDPVCLESCLPDAVASLYSLFERCGRILAGHNMAPANGGNMSVSVEGGLAVTSSGCNLGLIGPTELAWVRECSIDDRTVRYHGPEKPSSEAMMHWLIQRDFSGARAVVHAHDAVATSGQVVVGLTETPVEVPYGTVELARLAVEAFSGGADIIALKNHGYVAYGHDLDNAVATIVRKHLDLVSLSAGPDPG
ncbi:MAG: class II aldolase/adducin family protein [Deltaproteobacteria bacterium]|nr:class II aldolase/adducin family protein [Deltaproteobacteria bacterium]